MATALRPTQELRFLADARQLLAEASSFDEVKWIRDRAKAIREYAKSAALGLNVQNEAAMVALLAERKAGELLAGLRLRGGNRRSPGKTRNASLKGLGVSPSQSARWQRVAAIPEFVFEQYVRKATEQHKELTAAGLIRLTRAPQNTAGPGADNVRFLQRVGDALHELASRGKSFACVYAAPPLLRGNATHPGWRAACSEAGCELAGLPVRDVTEPNAHLHLLSAPEALLEAMKALRAWGFRYETCLVWAKTPGAYGRYWRGAHEVLLLGVRGHLPFRDNSLTSWTEAPGGGFSGASHFIRRLIEQASPAPYLDLFTDREAPGWTCAYRLAARE